MVCWWMQKESNLKCQLEQGYNLHAIHTRLYIRYSVGCFRQRSIKVRVLRRSGRLPEEAAFGLTAAVRAVIKSKQTKEVQFAISYNIYS